MIFSYKQLVTAFLLAAIGISPIATLADSGSDNGSSPSVAVDLDFRVVIPGVMRFRVGTDAADAVNEVLFEPSVGDIGTGGNVTATTNGIVTVSIFSNAGLITITPTNDTANTLGLTTVAGDDIPYSEIALEQSNAAFANPPLNNAGGTPTSPTPNLGNGKVTNYPSETWSYFYDNDEVYPVGEYTGTVTYTATSP
jgi:hypothetical protein